MPILEPWEIDEIIEGQDLEAKKATGRDGQGQLPKDFWTSYSAMANTEGGIILLGVQETHNGRLQVCGIINVKKVQSELWNGLNNRDTVSCNVLSNQDVVVTNIRGNEIIQIRIPRANRFLLPVFLTKNPFGNTYRRNFEGDYRCDDETIKRMLADQVEDVRDGKLLEGFSFDDIHLPTFTAYRNAFKAVKPDHPWTDLNDIEFLRSIGGWAEKRETGRGGLTLAGILMFGKLRPILEAVPNYIVDYQERPPEASADSDRRWIDRITTDGSWSGNLYDFYKLTIQRITRDLKVPFRLKGTTRVDDTPVHEAMREALTNLLIHADFTGRVSLYVVKRQDMVGFRNPGLMRVPIRLAIKGGQSDCRNRNLQKMFQLVGLAEQAGSGLSKVFRNWKRQHWRKPELLERIAPDQTILRLRMVSILPEGTSEELEKRCGGPKFLQLKETARMALATVLIEGNVSHARLKSVTTDHPKDVSKTLASLVEDGLLVSRGATRGTVYYFPDEIPTDHEAEDDLEILSAGAAGKLGDSSKQVELSSQHSPGSSQQSIEGAYEEVLLRRVSENVRTARKSPKEIVRKTIISLCSGRFLTAQKLASLLDREMLSLQNHYLRHMIKSGQLRLQFPESPTHPKQAYTSASDSAL